MELTHASLVTNVRQSQAVLGFREDDVVVAVAPFFHAIGFNIVLPCSLAAGATIVTLPGFDLEAFLQAIQEYRATLTIVVPPMALALAGHPLVPSLLIRRSVQHVRSVPVSPLPQVAVHRASCS